MEEINTEQNYCLNVVLLGKTRAGISASANTILGHNPKDVAVESGTVGGITVTVYDTPGFCHTELKDDEIQQKYEEVLQKCESGRCVFLLVIKADRFSEEERKTVEKIEKLLGEKRLEKTWILFTRGDKLEDDNMTIKEFIDDNEPLKRLVHKYEQRYHVFNNKKKGPSDQVKGLLFEILKPYFDVLGEGAEILNPLKRKILTDSEPAAPVSSPSSRRIVLLGKSGFGKSAVGNTILGQKEFNSVMRMNSVTSECSVAQATVSGRSVSVVDTPGFFDTEMKPEELAEEIARSVYISSPGPHTFLIVFPVNMRFTEQEQKIPQIIEMLFGEEVLKYSIILFTHGDQLEEESVEELIQGNCRLRDLVDQCGGRFHVFNNKAQNNREQVNDLLQKIDSMIEQNGGGHYSNQMYEDAQRFRREEEEQRLRDEEERQREEEERKQQEEKQRQDEEKRRQEIERVRKEIEERIRAEMETQRFELERLKAEKQKEEEEEERKQDYKQRQDEEKRRQEIERVRKETEERIRAEMEAQRFELERLKAERQREETERKQQEEKQRQENERVKKEVEEKAKGQNENNGFKKFFSEYKKYFLIGIGVGTLIGVVGGAARGAAYGAAGGAAGAVAGAVVGGAAGGVAALLHKMLA